MNFRVKKGIGTPVVVAALVVIILVAAGAYFAFSGGFGQTSTSQSSFTSTSSTTGTKTTTSTSGAQSSSSTSSTTSPSTSSTSATTTSTTSLSSSSQSTTSTTTSTSSETIAPYGFANYKGIMGNFSQMDIKYSVFNATFSSSEEIAYFTVGHPLVSGVQTTEVNMTMVTAGTSGNSSQYALIFLDSNWNATMVSVEGNNFTGPTAQAYGSLFFTFFSLFNNYADIWSGYYTGFTATSSGQQTFGNLHMQVTTYSGSSIVYGGFAYGSVSISIGQVPNTNFTMLTNLNAQYSYGGSSATVTIELISATQP